MKGRKIDRGRRKSKVDSGKTATKRNKKVVFGKKRRTERNKKKILID